MFLEQIHKVLQTYPELFGVLMFCCGALTSHWLAIGRDKRKEFNEIADKIILQWADQAADPTPYRTVLTDDATLLRRHFSHWKRKKYEQVLDEYETAHGDSNQVELPGKVWEYKDKQRVANAVLAVVKLLKRQ